MLKRIVWTAALFALFSLSVTSAVAQDRPSDKLLSAFSVDADGNVKGLDSVEIDGKVVKVGDAIQAGMISNAGSDGLVLALAQGGLVSIAAESKVFLEIAQVATRKRECRCNCGASRDTYPPTVQADCAALNGQSCEHPAGTVRTLSGCGLTWVTVATIAEVESSETLAQQ